MNKFLACLLLAPTIALGQAQKNLVGFQDIVWGSSVAEIKQKFPNIKPRDICKGLASKEDRDNTTKFFKINNGNCITWEIDKYTIDGVNLLAQFNLDSNNKLKDVTLRKDRSDKDTPNYLNECDDAFGKIGQLLEIKYGKGFTPHNSTGWFESIGYQNTDVKIWNLGKTKITLTNSWANKYVDIGICMMLVNYEPSKLAEASKL